VESEIRKEMIVHIKSVSTPYEKTIIEKGEKQKRLQIIKQSTA